MDASARQAYEDTVWHRCPGWVLRRAIKTDLHDNALESLIQRTLAVDREIEELVGLVGAHLPTPNVDPAFGMFQLSLS